MGCEKFTSSYAPCVLEITIGREKWICLRKAVSFVCTCGNYAPHDKEDTRSGGAHEARDKPPALALVIEQRVGVTQVILQSAAAP